MGFIIEALINQHPVFEFLKYRIFKLESIILGSIALIFPFIEYMMIGIALGNAMLANWKLTKAIYFISLIGILVIMAYFIMLYKSYNWKLGYLKYFSYPFLITGVTGSIITGIIQKSSLILSYEKINFVPLFVL